MNKSTEKDIKSEKVKGTSRLACTCKHDFQDSVYGKGIRLHNVTKLGKFRCTVCSNLK